MKNSSHRARLGQWAEQRAKQYLEQQGYQCIAQNFHSRYGEIDLIMRQVDLLLFVEVKARAKKAWASANMVISKTKQAKIAQTALYFLQCHPVLQTAYCRFDVISIDFQQAFTHQAINDFSNLRYDLEWIENAFTFDE